MTEFIGYTVSEFMKKFRPDGKGHISHIRFDDGGKDITFDEIVCDVCNKEIVQSSDMNEKVIWFTEDSKGSGKWALCSDCSKKQRSLKISQTFFSDFQSALKGINSNISKSELYDMISPVVMNSLAKGFDNGWYCFKDSDMDVDKWLTLTYEQREKYPFVLTEKGKSESDMKDVFSVVSDFNKSSNNLADDLFGKIDADEHGNIRIELKGFGKSLKKMYDLSGLDFNDFVKKRLGLGVRKMFSEFIVLEKDEKNVLGNARMGKNKNV